MRSSLLINKALSLSVMLLYSSLILGTGISSWDVRGADYESIYLPVNCDNSTCETAIPVSANGGIVMVDSICGGGASNICESGATGSSWFLYTAPSLDYYAVTISSILDSNQPNTRVSVYSGTCDFLSCIASNDDADEGYTSFVAFDTSPGESYLIEWDDRWDNGAFSFEVNVYIYDVDCPEIWANIGEACDDGDLTTEFDVINFDCICAGVSIADCTVINSTCETAIPLGEGVFFNDTICGDGAANQCFNGPGVSAASWYTYVPDVSGSVTVSSSLDPDTTDTNLSIYTGTCDDLICVGADSDGGIGFTSIVSFEAVAGQTYYIEWDDYLYISGGFQFSIFREIQWDCVEIEANFGDACDDGDPNTSNDSISADCICEGEPIVECTVYDVYNGTNQAVAIWLMSGPYADGYVFSESGTFSQNTEEGTAQLIGTIQSTNDPNSTFELDINFVNGSTWEEWSALGRGYKDEPGVVEDNYLDYIYYEMDGANSTLTGTGAYDGAILSLSHAPANFYYGFQIGLGANATTAVPGMGGFCTYASDAGNGQMHILLEGNCPLDHTFYCPDLEGSIGDVCDDGDSTTYDDIILDGCICDGIAFDCAIQEANFGDPCDDGSNCTFNEVIQEDCQCNEGIEIGCPNDIPYNSGIACDDGNNDTENDLTTCDCTCVGTLIYCDEFEAYIGEPCDDGDEFTSGDIVLSDCICQGDLIDADNDGITDSLDNCPQTSNANQDDLDEDGIGDVCDEDADGDGVLADLDCNDLDATIVLEGQIGEPCDDGNEFTFMDIILVDCQCIGTLEDADMDGITDSLDNCPEMANEDQADLDQDGIGDACDEDVDGDGVLAGADCDDLDATITTAIGDSCDDGDPNTSDDVILIDCSCHGTLIDADGDGIADAEDNCPDVFNPNQADLDQDGIGDVCDEDADGDDVPGLVDCNDLDASIIIEGMPGDTCDDGLDTTMGDMIMEDCSCSGTVGLDEYSATAFDFALIPNPANEHLSIKFSQDLNYSGELILTDILGRLIISHDFIEIRANRPVNLNVSDLDEGLYLIHVFLDGRSVVKRFVIEGRSR